MMKRDEQAVLELERRFKKVHRLIEQIKEQNKDDNLPVQQNIKPEAIDLRHKIAASFQLRNVKTTI